MVSDNQVDLKEILVRVYYGSIVNNRSKNQQIELYLFVKIQRNFGCVYFPILLSAVSDLCNSTVTGRQTIKTYNFAVL